MDILSIIQKKRDKLNLNENEINFFINASLSTSSFEDNDIFFEKNVSFIGSFFNKLFVWQIKI